MTRRFHKSQDYAADLEFIAICDAAMRKRDSSLSAKNNFGACACREFVVTAYEVGVKMSLDDVFNLEMLRGGFSDVFIDIALRIDDNSLAVGADEIRRVRKTAEIKLLEVHSLVALFDDFKKKSLVNYHLIFKN
jgi:hypothetical protein